MTEEKGLVESKGFSLLSPEDTKRELMTIKKFQNTVKSLMTEGLDYGLIPGAGKKPALFKPGAEKLIKMNGLADSYVFVGKTEKWDDPMFFNYLIKCVLTHMASGNIVGEGMGSCNSKESKYAYRWIGERDIPADFDKATAVSKIRRGQGSSKWTVYRVDNDDLPSQVNTILKMAKKRAMVDACLGACRISAIFTQDIEDTGYDHMKKSEPAESRKQVEKPAVDKVEKTNTTEKKPTKPAKPTTEKNSTLSEFITQEQQEQIFTALDGNQIDHNSFKEYLKDKFGVEKTLHIKKIDLMTIFKWIEG